MGCPRDEIFPSLRIEVPQTALGAVMKVGCVIPVHQLFVGPVGMVPRKASECMELNKMTGEGYVQ
jgi:hypothetical protein